MGYFKHGEGKSRLFGIWSHIKQRCHNSKSTGYKNYGARGITVCEEWRQSFEAFRDWALKSEYEETLTIERKDVNKGYSPENCIWIASEKQNRNKRNTKFVIIFGQTLGLATAHELYSKVPYVTVKSRLRAGWSDEYAVLLPSIANCPHLNINQNFKEYTVFGETAILPVHIKNYAVVDSSTVFGRINKGWHVLNAVLLPKINGRLRGQFVKKCFNPSLNPLEAYGEGT